MEDSQLKQRDLWEIDFRVLRMGCKTQYSFLESGCRDLVPGSLDPGSLTPSGKWRLWP